MKPLSPTLTALVLLPALLSAPALAAPPAPPAPPAPTGETPWDAPSPVVSEEARVAEAKELFLAGREALKQGELMRALGLFRQSQERHAAPGTLLNVANCEEQLGLLASAWQHFRAVLGLLPPGDDRLPLAASHAAELAPRVPRVVIRLAPGAPADTKVTLDDLLLPPSNLGADLAIDPGRHTIVASAPSRSPRRYTLTMTEGQHLVTTVEPSYGQAFGEGEWSRVEELSKLDKKAEPPPPASRAAQRNAGYALGGVGLVALGIGVASGAMAIVVNNQLKAMCPRPLSCTSDGVAMEQIDRGQATMSTVTLVAGLVGLGAGIPLVVTGQDGPVRAPVVTTTALPGGFAVGLSGRF